MSFANYDPDKLIQHYNRNTGLISKPVSNESHINLYSGKTIRNYSGNTFHPYARYGDLIGINGSKKSRIVDEIDLVSQYKKFNLKKDSSQQVGWWPIKEPYILRGIQRSRKKKPQYWGGAVLGDVPGLGGAAEWIDSKVHDILRLGMSIASPRGLVFIGSQLLFKLYTKAEYSFISTKIPVWDRLVSVFKKKEGGPKKLKDIAKILLETRSERSYAGVNDISTNFGHRYTWNGDRVIDPYNEADAGVFTRHDLAKAMIPISFENIDGTDYIEFRGMNLKGLNQNFSANWQSKTYMGRPDAFHTYGGFQRGTLNVSFTTVAFSFTGMKGMYQKLNILAGMTAPQYNPYKRMIAPLATLSVGDYINGEHGYVKSVNIVPIQNLPWEIGLTGEKGNSLTLREAMGLKAALGKLGKLFNERAEKKTLAVPDGQTFATEGSPKNGQVLPRGFDVQVNFQTIENELPTQLGANRLDDRTKQYFGPDGWLIDKSLGEQ
tara:strand:+ start:465 stop:1937 length:1473 start_codon:yes stop_codon:yes gene_type:complete